MAELAEFAAKLVAYEPDGARIGPLPKPTKWEASFPHNDDGALTLTYSSLAARGPLVERGLLTGLEVAVEVTDHDGQWFEPDGGRFVLIARDQDAADQTRSKVLTLPAYSWLMGKARNNDTSALYPPGHAQAGKRGFEAASAGGVLAQLLAENAARGGIPLTTTATASHDSAGQVWATVANRAYAVGAELRAIRDDLVGIGLADWRTAARQLLLYNPDTVLGVDRSGTVRLRLGKDVGEAPSTETLEKLIHKVLVQTEAGGTVTVEAVGVPTPWGEWEGYLPIGAVDTEADAIVAGQAEVDHNAKVGAQYTRSLTLPGAKHWPFTDYDRGDWITAPTTGTGEKVRVQQITLTGGEHVGGSIVLNDRLLEAELRRAKALAAVTGTASSVSPTGGVTPPDSYAGREPAAPSGLLLDTDVYVDAGVNRATVTASWVGPTQGTDGLPIVAASYGVQWRYGDTGPWSAVLPSTDEQQTIEGLTLGSAVQVQVQAVTASGIAGPFSAPVQITTASDVTAPQAPSTPTASCRLGVITVAWDGQPAAGVWPADFARVEVAMGSTAVPAPSTVVGTLTEAGSLKVTGQTYGEDRYFRLRPVDTSGNVGDWSATSLLVTVVGVEGPDLEANSVTANAIAVGALDGQLITGATIRTAAGDDRLELSGTSFKGYVGGNLGLQLDPNALVAYTSAGDLKFRLSAYTGAGTMTFVDFLQALNIKTDGIEVYTGSTSADVGTSVGYLTEDGATGALLMFSNTEDIQIRTTNNNINIRAMDVDLYANGTRRLTVTSGGSVGLDNLLTATTATAQIGLGAAVGTLYPLRRITSSLKYKQDVLPHHVDLGAVLSLEPRSWRDKAEVELDPDTTHRYVGLIAEQVHDAGLTEFVQYAADDDPDGLAYDRFAAVVALAAYKDLHARVTALETA